MSQEVELSVLRRPHCGSRHLNVWDLGHSQTSCSHYMAGGAGCGSGLLARLPPQDAGQLTSPYACGLEGEVTEPCLVL